ncbi:MAG: hypothetical protein QOF70_2480 [Acetobacteraceae bacterium]|nr:hypothetical protein [Acetobacteraceae bacterium]
MVRDRLRSPEATEAFQASMEKAHARFLKFT